LRGNTEGTWSLFSGVEAQDHLYVFTAFDFLIPEPVHKNKEESFNPNKNRHPSPRNVAKILIERKLCKKNI